MSRLVPARLLGALHRGTPTPESNALLAHEARRRIRVAAALGAGGYALFLLVELTSSGAAASLERPINRLHDVIGLLLCAVLWLATHARTIEDRALLRIAMLTEIVLVMVISIAVPWAGFIRTGHISSLTWTVPIIILFALLIPVRPIVTAWVSGVCALTIPAGLWLLDSCQLIEASTSDLIQALATGGVGVGIASIASRTVYGARQQAAAARIAGSYELVERLGQGGMGEVWRAQHLLLARPAAVKLILPDTLRGPSEERDSVSRRFTREAQITASLRSPHTVELFDFGAAADERLYYAMELLDGINLELFVYQFGAVEPRRAVHWLRQACHSLGEAHARGLIHRDIKPANLFLCRQGRDVDVIKVLDFGLTRIATGAGDGESTVTSARVGTPSYMAPEQVFGLETGPRTDVYALGCVGYWLLAGAKPFESDSAADLMRQHAQVDPPPLSRRAKQPVPVKLEAVIMSCLAKDPDDRPADADRFAAGLGAALDRAWTDAEAEAWWIENLPGRPDSARV